MPTVSRPMPSTRGRRPVATRSRSPRSSRPSSSASDVLVAVAPRVGRVGAEDELDPVAAQDLAERLAQRRGLAREHVPAALDQHDLAAEAPDGLRHLHADRPATEDQQAPRDGLHARHLAVGPHPVELAEARDRRDERIRSARHDDVVGRVAHAADLDRARPGEPAAAAQQRDPVRGEPLLLAGVRVVRDHEVPPRERRVDVDLGGRQLLRVRRVRPRRAGAASWTGCTRSRSTRPRPARARPARRAGRLRQARPHNARRATRRRSR